MSTRISARLDDKIADALDLYHRTLGERARAGTRQLLSLAGLFDGPADLSERYKEEFAEALDERLPRDR